MRFTPYKTLKSDHVQLTSNDVIRHDDPTLSSSIISRSVVIRWYEIGRYDWNGLVLSRSTASRSTAAPGCGAVGVLRRRDLLLVAGVLVRVVVGGVALLAAGLVQGLPDLMTEKQINNYIL